MPEGRKKRAIGRLVLTLTLNIIDNFRRSYEVDSVDFLIMASITAGNVAHMGKSLYAELHEIPPDEERRSVSIRQIAESLHLPFETVRRRVSNLVTLGLCVKVKRGGYIVPSSQMSGAAFEKYTEGVEVALMRLLKDLEGLGIVEIK